VSFLGQWAQYRLRRLPLIAGWVGLVLSENSNLASCRQLVLMDESAQPVVSTYPSWTATVLSVPTVRSSYHS
jgi:hypothetical protein